MMYFHCRDCHEHFAAPEKQLVYDESEAWGEVARTYSELELCPFCGSEDLLEVYMCDVCGKDAAVPGGDVCVECEKKLIEEAL